MTTSNECARSIEWAGGTHTFNLNRPDVLAVLSGDPAAPKMARSKAGSAIRLDKLTGHNGDTPAAALTRFMESSFSIPDIERIVMYGLWGGGMSLADADALVSAHIRGKALSHGAVLASEVLSALFTGAAEQKTAEAA